MNYYLKLKLKLRGWKNGSAVKREHYSGRGLISCFQQTQSKSQLPLTLVPGHLTPFSLLLGHVHAHGTYKLIQKHTHTQTETKKNFYSPESFKKYLWLYPSFRVDTRLTVHLLEKWGVTCLNPLHLAALTVSSQWWPAIIKLLDCMFLSKNLVLRLEKAIILQPRARHTTVHTQLKKVLPQGITRSTSGEDKRGYENKYKERSRIKNTIDWWKAQGETSS